MSRLPRVSGFEVVRALERAGFRVARIRGSHHALAGPQGRVVIVPVHGKRALPVGTLRDILRQAGLEPSEFRQLLGLDR